MIRARPVELAAFAAGAGALMALGLAADAAARSPLRPDLVETTVLVRQPVVRAGGWLQVTDVVRNRGGMPAAPSTTGYHLSSEPIPGHNDVHLGRRSVPPLAAGARSAATRPARIPASTVPGSYWVLACADDRRRVVESKEENNCRAATRP